MFGGEWCVICQFNCCYGIEKVEEFDGDWQVGEVIFYLVIGIVGLSQFLQLVGEGLCFCCFMGEFIDI